MEGAKEIKGKKNMIGKMWKRWKSLGRSGWSDSMSPVHLRVTRKSMSWNGLGACNNVGKGNNGRRVVPKGCFSVYVGAEKRKFVVRIEYTNHPLFRVLLEQAVAEYGYNTCGPIELPCDVEIFYRVLKEMDVSDDDSTRRGHSHTGKGSKVDMPTRLPDAELDDRHKSVIVFFSFVVFIAA